MATLVITVNATGSADEEDRRAMNLAIDRENEIRAAQTPPGTPLPKSTAAERKASYEAIMGPKVQSAHQSLIREAGDSVMFRDLKPRWDIATDAQRAAAAAQLPPLP
jgi:hypothetical protein